jgi:hypothetical protein
MTECPMQPFENGCRCGLKRDGITGQGKASFLETYVIE